MALFKCKMCGGTLEITDGLTVAECEYCGTKQTLPKLNDDKKANLYDRANYFRRNNEFDKAAGIYEQILSEDNTDAESYWSLVLCRYGIEYVEDPVSHNRVPTVNRTQYNSVLTDKDYLSALKYADLYQRVIYESEAKTIDDIQKSILAISRSEAPFDIFICYKETDSLGMRTPDSVYAQDIYKALTDEGYKVFFARITLESKLGTAYEPYIFAALNSAKVMLVVGTKPEHFNAVWVRNEWNRYLSLIKNGEKKTLIPIYSDMSPYELPEEFSYIQAQDMGKIGFMQDLLHGIKKLIPTDQPKTTVVKETVITAAEGNNVATLLKRAFMFLEDKNWASANGYCERILDIDPENAQAYLYKLMLDMKVSKLDELQNCSQSFDSNPNYQKVLRFGDAEFAELLKDYNAQISSRNARAKLESVYARAVSTMNSAAKASDYLEAARMFRQAGDYKNAAFLADDCTKKADISTKTAIYNAAVADMSQNTFSGYEAAIRKLESIPSWNDSAALLDECQTQYARLAAQKAQAEEASRKQAQLELQRLEKHVAGLKRNKVILLVTLLLQIVVSVFGCIIPAIFEGSEFTIGSILGYIAVVILFNLFSFLFPIIAFASGSRIVKVLAYISATVGTLFWGILGIFGVFVSYQGDPADLAMGLAFLIWSFIHLIPFITLFFMTNLNMKRKRL